MKNKALMVLTIVQLMGIAKAFSQNVSINTTGSAADTSAMVDISSTSKGLLIPRMSEAQRTAIFAPAEALLVYQTDNVKGFYYYSTAAGWTPFLYGGGNQWSTSGSHLYYNSGNIGIGTAAPTSKLHIIGTNPLTLIGLQLGASTDSLLSVTSGVVRKIPVDALTSLSVTSVGLSLPNIFTVSGSPVTSTGTLSAILASQSANRVFAGPNGSAGTPLFRSLVPADLPVATTTTTGAVSIGSGLSVTGAGVLSATTQTATGTAGGDLTGTFPNPTLAASGVTAGAYGNNTGTSYPYLTVDAKGRITAAATQSIAFPVTSVNGSSGAVSLGIGNLNDATITAPAANQLLQYNGSRWVNATPAYLSTAITSLNGLTAATQTFATPGTGGTAPAWSSAGSVHTLNIPLASAASVTAGLLSNADYTTFTNKPSASSVWSLSGNSGTTAPTNFIGTTDLKSLRFRTNDIQSLFLDSLGNVAVGSAPAFTAGLAREKFLVDAGSTVANPTPAGAFNVISGKGYLDSYLQLNIQNNAATAAASSDIVASNDAATESANFIDMGINSSGNTSTGVIGGASTAYLYGAGNDFAIGNGTANKNLLLFTGGTASSNEAMRINSSGNIGIGTTAPTSKLHIIGTNPLKLMGLQVGSPADSLLTVASGVVRKIPVDALTGLAVTSVGLSLPNIFTVSGSPVTSTGTLSATFASQSANQVFAGPNGSAGTPLFRSLVPADLPVATTTTTGAVSIGTGLSVTGAGVLSATASNWSLTGNSGITPVSNFIGTTDSRSLRFRTNHIQRMIVDSIGNVAIGSSPTFAASPNMERLLVDAGSTAANPSTSYNVISGKGYIDSYLQLNIQNNAATAAASSDVVASNDAATESANFIDMGINSSGNSSTGVTGGANTAYLYSTGSDFAIGNGSSNRNLIFFTGSPTGNTERMRIDADGKVNIGTYTTGSDFTVYQNPGNSISRGIRLTGNSIGGTSSGTGVALTLGYNVTNNKQLWIGDPDYLGNAASAFVRYSASNGYAILDGIDGTNATRKPIALGVGGDANSAIILGSDLNSTTPSSYIWGNGNMAIGSGYRANTAPDNGLLVQGNVGLGTTAPTAALHLKAGTATASTAPLKLTAGTSLTTAEAGAVEFDGTNYFATTGTTRYTLAKTLTNTASLNFTTAANSTSTLTITVTGAVAGDAVVLGIPAANTNGIYTAYVSAANTVTVKCFNNTGSAISAGAGTFRVSVLRY